MELIRKACRASWAAIKGALRPMPMIPPVVRACVNWAHRAFDQARRKADALRADRSGNVAIIFAIAIIPIFGAVATAVDYSRANSARTAMQVALDAAALMVAKEAANLANGQVQTKATTYFNSQFNRPDVNNLNLTFSMVSNGPGDFTVVAEAAGAIDTSIAQVIGKKTIDIRATAQVRWGFKGLELALALDNTGSMAQKNKITELKSAVKLLFSILKTNSKVPGDTKIAVIPFNTVVNIGTDYVDSPWMSFDATVTKSNWNGCVADRDQPDVDKVLILLTDGLNTANRFTTVPSQIDARTAAVCDNIKQANIKLYTVRVIEGNLALLQGCATAPNMFFDVQVASDLRGVFVSIAASLSGARLAR